MNILSIPSTELMSAKPSSAKGRSAQKGGCLWSRYLALATMMATTVAPAALAGVSRAVYPRPLVTDILSQRMLSGATTRAIRDTVPVDPFDLQDGISYPSDSLLVVLTPDLLTRFTHVWDAIQADSVMLKDSMDIVDSVPFVFNDSIRIPNAPAGQPRVLLHNEHGWQKFPAFPRVAAKFPKVAAAIRRSKLSDTQFLRIAQSLGLAWSMNHYMVVTMGDPGGIATGNGLQEKVTVHPDTTMLRGKNLRFYREHQSKIDQLHLWW